MPFCCNFHVEMILKTTSSAATDIFPGFYLVTEKNASTGCSVTAPRPVWNRDVKVGRFPFDRMLHPVKLSVVDRARRDTLANPFEKWIGISGYSWFCSQIWHRNPRRGSTRTPRGWLSILPDAGLRGASRFFCERNFEGISILCSTDYYIKFCDSNNVLRNTLCDTVVYLI